MSRALVGAGVCLLIVSLARLDRASAQANLNAAALKNPIARTAESIAAGKDAYRRNCASCHGPEAKGGRAFEEAVNPEPDPPDLTDATWDHGSSDGEIFSAIRDGIGPRYFMMPYADRFKDETQIWNIINYLRSLNRGTAGP